MFLPFRVLMQIYCLPFSSGKPDLKPSLRCLTISRLKEFEDFLYDELEPNDICDVLFEESAVDIPSHDTITEPTRRRKRTECLLKTVEENKHECFHFFLYIIQKTYPIILQELEKSTPSPIEVGMFAFFLLNNLLACVSLMYK